MAYGLLIPREPINEKLGWLDYPSNIGLLHAALGMLANNTGHYGAFGPAAGAGGLMGLQAAMGTQQQNLQNRRNNRRDARSDYFNREQLGLAKKDYELKEEARTRSIRAGGLVGNVLSAGGETGNVLSFTQPQSKPLFQSPPAKYPTDFASAQTVAAPTEVIGGAPWQVVDAQIIQMDDLVKREPWIASDPVYQETYKRLQENRKFLSQQGEVKSLGDGFFYQEGMTKPYVWDDKGNKRYVSSKEIQELGLKRAAASASKLTVDAREQTEEAKAVGKAYGDQYADIQKSAFAAQSKIDRYKRLGSLLEGVDTGKLTPLGTNIASYAQSLGINIDKNLGNKQAAEALSNEIALTLRSPAGGAGMPGALSDKDREFLVSMVPGIEKTPQGRKMILDTAIKLHEREKDVARMARDYRKRNGRMDEGFYDTLSDFSAKHPLFPNAETGNSRAKTKSFDVDGKSITGTLDAPSGRYFVIQGNRKFWIEE